MTSNIDCEDPLSLTCRLCNQTYKHKDGPVMLQCLHSYCKQCLTEYIQKQDNTDNKITCPTCNNPFKDANFDFPTNLRLSNLVELKTYQEQVEADVVKCQTCEGASKDATTFSINCRKFLCNQCRNIILKFSDDEDHEFSDLTKKEEFKINSRPSKCQKHKKHDLELYCNDCKILICSLCSKTDHCSHEQREISEISSMEKADLQKLTNGVDDALGTMDETIQQIQEMRDKVKVSTKEATNRINKMCDDLILAVENRRKVLKRRCQELSEGKDNVLSHQMIEIEQLRRNLGFAQLHAKDAISNHSDEEVLSVKKMIENRLHHTMEKYHQQSLELREDDTIDTYTEAKPLLEGIEKLGFFPNVPDPSKCSVKILPFAIIGKEKEIDIVLKDETGKPVEGKDQVQYELRKTDEVPDNYIPPKVTITQRNNGTIRNSGTTRLRFTPEQPGEYEMAIMVQNKPITDPLKITTLHPKDYRGFPIRDCTYKNVGGDCRDVAVHTDNTVYATDYSNHTIKVFKPDGAESQIGISDNNEGQFSRPWGITLIDDTIYVVSNGNSTIAMYSINGRFIGSFGGNGTGSGQLSYPTGICTDGKGRLLVADQFNKRIQVFTSQGNFINSIPCSTGPFHVAVDPVGNIHVALRDNHHIAVYGSHKEQQPIETYNLGGILRYPSSIHIDSDGYRFIGTGTGQVYITDPTGTLIATRRSNVSGVTTDKNGIIYVAECSNNCVSVY